MPSVLFGDSEAAAIGHVRATLGTVPVVSVVPSPRPERFVTISRTGGTKQSQVTEVSQLTIDAWGDSKEDAQDLAQVARQAVHDLRGREVGGVTFHRVSEFGGPAWLPDPDSTQPRFTFTVQVLVRALPA